MGGGWLFFCFLSIGFDFTLAFLEAGGVRFEMVLGDIGSLLEGGMIIMLIGWFHVM